MTQKRQLSFSGGELDPSLYARVDINKYASGLRTCRNQVIKKQGGTQNRGGTQYIGEVKDSSKFTRIIPFVFNDSQTYVFEFGEGYIRFIQNDAYLTVSSVTAWSAVTAYSVGDLVENGGVNYYCILAHTNQVPPNTTYWHALTGSTFEIPNPYSESELRDIRFVQSADIINLVHPSHAPRELRRNGATDWTLITSTFGPRISAPSVSNNLDVIIGNRTHYIVTAVGIDGEESLSSNTVSGDDDSGVSVIVSWPAVTDAVSYKVYKNPLPLAGGAFGFLAQITDVTYQESGTSNDENIDYTQPPPATSATNPFSSSGNYPTSVSYSQQRLMLGGTNNDPEKIWGSRIGSINNFERPIPVDDDDSIAFTLYSSRVNRIQHIIEMNRLFVFTSGNEWSVNGNEANVITPGSINARRQTQNGSNNVAPLLVNGSILYIQDRGSLVRDFIYDFDLDVYRGNDLTIFSHHLIEGLTILDWAYQNNPNSIIWAVRSDGDLIALTYIREHEMLAWHRHDFTNGTVESVTVIPDGTEDSVYFAVKRRIDGSTVRYIEKLTTHQFADTTKNVPNNDIIYAKFLDSCVTLDGVNTSTSHSMTLSGGTNWDHTETLTLTSSTSYFVAGDVGNEIHIYNGQLDVTVKCTIIAFTSDTVVSIRPDITVPTELRNESRTTWGKAVTAITGLDHLEGETVGVFSDGFVVGSPNNPNYDTYTVSSGSITLDKPYVVVTVGLPITSDLETLDIDTVNGRPLADRRKLVTSLTMFIERSRGIFAGTNVPSDNGISGLEELKITETGDLDNPPALTTDSVDIRLRSEWDSNGRIFIRQVDPIPLKILSVMPTGYIPIGVKS